jgi:AcrR family transcriptional regulator
VSVRAIADAVGVTPPSIYLHFDDKDALIYAVCEMQFAKLDRVIDEAVAGVDDPVECLRRRGRAYIRFGVDHPEHYRILLMGKADFTREDFESGNVPGITSFLALVANVQACIDTGAFGPRDPMLVACGLWSTVHGITSLRITMPGFPVVHTADELIDHVFDVHLLGLATGDRVT